MRIMAVAVALLAATAACANDADVDTDATPAPVEGTAPVVMEGSLLDPNVATREQLLTVPQLDTQLADALLAGRPYNDMLAVNRVLAPLSEADRDSIYTRVWLPLDLNTASGEEILLIPGVGERMKHEFEEYRPYTDMGQFRREIGKYVDDAEVARLERYVTIKQ